MRRAKGVLPRVGEQWIVDRAISGLWSFAMVTTSRPLVITGERDANPAVESLLTALEEGGLIEDIQEWLEKLAPARPDYRHHHTGEDNADAHLKRTILGHQVVLPITAGALDLGPWEQVFYAEFDGQRRKRVVVKVMGLV